MQALNFLSIEKYITFLFRFFNCYFIRLTENACDCILERFGEGNKDDDYVEYGSQVKETKTDHRTVDDYPLSLGPQKHEKGAVEHPFAAQASNLQTAHESSALRVPQIHRDLRCLSH